MRLGETEPFRNESGECNMDVMASTLRRCQTVGQQLDESIWRIVVQPMASVGNAIDMNVRLGGRIGVETRAIAVGNRR